MPESKTGTRLCALTVTNLRQVSSGLMGCLQSITKLPLIPGNHKDQ